LLFKHPCDEGVVRGAAPCSESTEGARTWVLVVTILGSSLAFVDGTVVNVALPALQRGLGATIADVQWVVEAYALFFSALLLVGGSLGDRFGRRRVYAIGIAVFAGASALCGLAGSIRLLVVARALQGVGAALLVPGSLAIIAASFPEKERGRAIGAWSGFSAMTTAIGPVLGGWLIDHGGWRWAFLLNLPVALATFVLLFWRVPESRDPGASRQLDWRGAVLVTAGLGGLVYGLIESSRRGWAHPAVVVALVGGALSVVAFVVHEARSRAPMLPLSLFRSRRFTGANLLTAGLYGALAMALFVLPLDLIQVQGYSTTAAGAALLPLIGILFLLSRWSGGLVDRVGARIPLIVGPTIAALGFALLARPGVGGSYWVTFLPALVVLGLGMAVTVAPLTTTVMNAVDVAHAGIASGVNNAVSRAAGLIAIAVMSVLLQHVFDRQLERRIAGLGLRAERVAEVQAQRAMLANAQPPASASPPERIAIQHAIAEAFVMGVRLVTLTAAGLALASSAIAAVMIDPRGSAPNVGGAHHVPSPRGSST
jgi:EmrB/QacA subfamily drug resistance transporter